MGLKEVGGGPAKTYFEALQDTMQDLRQALVGSDSVTYDIDTVVQKLYVSIMDDYVRSGGCEWSR